MNKNNFLFDFRTNGAKEIELISIFLEILHEFHLKSRCMKSRKLKTFSVFQQKSPKQLIQLFNFIQNREKILKHKLSSSKNPKTMQKQKSFSCLEKKNWTKLFLCI